MCQPSLAKHYDLSTKVFFFPSVIKGYIYNIRDLSWVFLSLFLLLLVINMVEPDINHSFEHLSVERVYIPTVFDAVMKLYRCLFEIKNEGPVLKTGVVSRSKK